jgi:hypothetical protein
MNDTESDTEPKWNIYIHNSHNFDNHLLLAGFNSENNKNKLRGVPSSGEKVKILQYQNFTILDSYSFVPASLSSLTDTLSKQYEAKNEFMKFIPQCSEISWTNDKFSEEKYNKSTAKLAFPYHLATSIAALKKITKFPPIEEFTSTLTGIKISQQDYDNTNSTYELYQFENMYAYYIHYCLIDTVLLAEVCNIL